MSASKDQYRDPKKIQTSFIAREGSPDLGRGLTQGGLSLDWQRLVPRRGFEVLSRRWVVERTFAELSQNRRMSKDYERLCATGEAFVYAAMIRLLVRRLARA